MRKMKMSSFTKSFLGGAAGATMVVAVVFFSFTTNRSHTASPQSINQVQPEYATLPAHTASYLPPTSEKLRKNHSML